MNYFPTSESKTWIVEYRDKERKPDFITETRAYAMLKALKDKSVTFLELTDEKGNLAEVLEKREVKRIVKAEEKNKDELKRWICDYGVRHAMSVWPPEKCGCKETLKVHYSQLLSWCQEFYGISSSHQITEEMRSSFMKLEK